MSQRFRESLALILLALLPLHAMFVTVGTHILSDVPHSPLGFIAIWKEVFLGILLLLALIELVQDGKLRSFFHFDLLDWCILAGVILGIAVSIFNSQFSILNFFFGFKYDFVPLCAFFILRRATWSTHFLPSAARTLIMVGFVAAAFGILTLFLPMSFFTAIGYSDLHSLYRPNAPLAAFQFLENSNIRRIQSVMSGPNQFGLWLLLPFAANLQLLLKSFLEKRRDDALLYACGFILLSAAIVLTYSRSAWIASAVIVLLLVFLMLRDLIKVRTQKKILGVGALVLAALVISGAFFAPKILIRSDSLQGHLQKPVEALAILMDHPFGLGLGSSGPASNRVSDTCFFGKTDADVAWAKDRTDICTFVGPVQKTPVGKACACPLLTENWYLQWGVEMGWLGLLLSLMLPFLVLGKWKMENGEWKMHWPILAFLGVSVAGLFLHAFEDSAVAYSLWLLLAAVVFQRESSSVKTS